VIVQADTEFGTIEFLNAVRQRQWRAVVGVKNSRLLQDGRKLKDLPGNSDLAAFSISWFRRREAPPKPAFTVRALRARTVNAKGARSKLPIIYAIEVIPITFNIFHDG
jgi:hypothetical protein